MMFFVFALTAVVVIVTGDQYHKDPDQDYRSARYASAAELGAAHWYDEAHAAINERLNSNRNDHVAKNVIMFIGDGMSVPTLMAARTLQGQRAGSPGEESQLSFEAFPAVGLAKTYCVNSQIPDSACTATAYLSGVKSNQGTLGLTATVPRWDCAASMDTSTHVESIAAWALRDGRDAGIVTNTRITHASPAGAYAFVANRHWENDMEVNLDGFNTNDCPDIAHQLVHNFPGNQFKVVLGGGRQEFTPNTTQDEFGSWGLRRDGRNLVEEWRADKVTRGVTHEYVYTNEQLQAARATTPDYLLGIFNTNHMQYHMEATENNSPQPTLTQMVEAAVETLSRNERGFFLFVESGRIDHAHHEVHPELALDETIEMANAVSRALELTNREDTLIVVTADHAHVMMVNGYSPRGHPLLGHSQQLDDHRVTYQTLSYTNGPGFRVHTDGTRQDVTQEDDYLAMFWRAHVDVPLYSETHGGDDIAVFALGPRHQVFTGLYEQSQIPHLMGYAACLGDGPTACSGAAAASASLALIFAAAAALMERR